MFSLAGIPPLAGFFAKYFVFLAAIKASLLSLAVIGVVATVVGAYYYLPDRQDHVFRRAGADFDPMHGELRLVRGARRRLHFVLFIPIAIWSWPPKPPPGRCFDVGDAQAGTRSAERLSAGLSRDDRLHQCRSAAPRRAGRDSGFWIWAGRQNAGKGRQGAIGFRRRAISMPACSCVRRAADHRLAAFAAWPASPRIRHLRQSGGQCSPDRSRSNGRTTSCSAGPNSRWHTARNSSVCRAGDLAIVLGIGINLAYAPDDHGRAVDIARGAWCQGRSGRRACALCLGCDSGSTFGRPVTVSTLIREAWLARAMALGGATRCIGGTALRAYSSASPKMAPCFSPWLPARNAASSGEVRRYGARLMTAETRHKRKRSRLLPLGGMVRSA